MKQQVMAQAIHFACAAGDLDTLKEPVTCGAEVECANISESTCLHISAYHGHIECCRYLVEDLNQDSSFEDQFDNTPLFLANLNKKNACLKLLNSYFKTNQSDNSFAQGDYARRVNF